MQPVALRFSDAHERISRAVEFVGATTLVESLWRVACADRLVAHVALLPARACTHADRRALAQTLREGILLPGIQEALRSGTIDALADFYDSLRPEQQAKLREFMDKRGRSGWHPPSWLTQTE